MNKKVNPMDRKFPVMISLDLATLRVMDELAAQQRQTRSAYVRWLIDQTAKAADNSSGDE